MNRPARQRAHLVEKIARKESLNSRRPGKKLKAWRKWAEHYKAVAEGTPAPAAS
jgi:hypothetical protein